MLDGASHWYDCYECADGHSVSIGSLEPEFDAYLLEELGIEKDPSSPRSGLGLLKATGN